LKIFLTDSLLGFGSERPGDDTASLQQLALGTGKESAVERYIFQQHIE
jgi:hypothetical protein